MMAMTESLCSTTGTATPETQKTQANISFQYLSPLQYSLCITDSVCISKKGRSGIPMDLFTLIPRTIIGVTYPAFASLKAVLSDSPESCGAWLRSGAGKLYIFSSFDQPKKIQNTFTNTTSIASLELFLQILGGARCLLPGGADAGPRDQPPAVLLPQLSDHQVRLPGLVHGSSRVEWQRRHLQQCEYQTVML